MKANKTEFRPLALLRTAVALFCIGASYRVYSQILDFAPNPTVSSTDDVGVDLMSGRPVRSMGTISLGAAGSPDLEFGVLSSTFQASGRTPLYARFDQPCVTYGGVPGCIYYRMQWNINGDTEFYSYPPNSPTAPGFTLQGSMWNGTTLTRKDGAVWAFPNQYPSFATSVTYPDGTVLAYNYYLVVGQTFELRSIVSNRGYMLHIEGFEPYEKTIPTKVVLINLNTDYCAPLAPTCTGLTVNWPSLTYTSSQSGNVTTYYVTDNLGRVTTQTLSKTTPVLQGNFTKWTTNSKFTSPGGVWFEIQQENMLHSPNMVGGVPCTMFGYLQWLKNPDGQWNYSWGAGSPTCGTGGVSGGTSTGPDGVSQKVEASPQAFVDGLNRKTQFSTATFSDYFGSDTLGVTGLIKPGSNRFDYSYDGRRNLNQTTATAKTGGATISASASYPATCTPATYKTCNQPEYTLDPKGNRTDFTYSPTHGSVLTKKLPPDENNVRPEVRYTYQLLSALYKGPSGTLVPGPPIWMLTATSTCKTGVTCAGTAEEVITSFSYNDNLLLKTTTISTGTGVALSSVTKTYDVFGNVISIDGPMPGAADTTYSFYDDARQKLGEIGPDPDGNGPLPRPASRSTYDLDGRVTRAATGTANGTTLVALNSMVIANYVDTVYDAMGRSSRKTDVGGGIIHRVTQANYDVRGRNICTAIRMNPANFSSLPSDACALGTPGVYGPDRVTKNVYDAAGQIIQVIQGLGTADQRAYQTNSYDSNGRLVDSIDANGNRTRLAYDGFDRLQYHFFPASTPVEDYEPETVARAFETAGSHNPDDYEFYGYDSNSNRTSWRRRDGNTIEFAFDKLNRQTLKNLPGGAVGDVYTRYDLLNNVTFRCFDSACAASVQYTYDGLKRVSSTTDMNGRNVAFQYNEASARTRITYPDGNYIGYLWDDTNRLKSAGWNSTSGLYSFTYNNLGQIAAISKGSGATNYSYDFAGRLDSMGNDFAGTTSDVVWSFPDYNPAAQIVKRSASSALFDYREVAASMSSKSFDGLNRDVTIAALTGGYDARRNLTFDGVRTFTYDLENRLLTANGGAATLALTYDPEGRLANYSAGGIATRFLYDGIDLIAEYDTNGNILRRYVHGPLSDDPIAWLEGGGTADTRYFYTNNQGSIAAYANSSGALLNLYKYGPYGEPKNALDGDDWSGPRFRFTGQISLPEAKLYYYKARVYDPQIGRFLQTDPIGTDDDLNLYAYVGNDPVNHTDPTGEKGCGAGGVMLGICGTDRASAGWMPYMAEPKPIPTEADIQATIKISAALVAIPAAIIAVVVLPEGAVVGAGTALTRALTVPSAVVAAEVSLAEAGASVATARIAVNVVANVANTARATLQAAKGLFTRSALAAQMELFFDAGIAAANAQRVAGAATAAEMAEAAAAAQEIARAAEAARKAAQAILCVTVPTLCL